MPDVAILDYGMGNLRSVQKAFEAVGASARLVPDQDALGQPDAVVLPGVGAFAKCMANLHTAGLDDVVRDWVRSARPFLGICLGLQLLFERSEEGSAPGLGLLPGVVRKLPAGPAVKVPQIGWNVVEPQNRTPLVPEAGRYYFVHSYYADPADHAMIAGRTDHGVDFASVVEFPGGAATQFHPEKSGVRGLELIARFLEIHIGARAA